MHQRTTNIACLLLAVAGLSFGIGQSVGQDHAQADARAARVLSVKDTLARAELHTIFRMQLVLANRLDRINEQTHAVCLLTQRLVAPGLTGSFPDCP